jgi:hypothetical protein
MKNFVIEIHGPGLEYGVGKIKKSQFVYWNENEDDLSLALNNNYDYEKNKTPKASQLKNYYNEYNDLASFSGALSDSCIIKVFDENGALILDQSFNDIKTDIEDNDGDVDLFSENEDEFHVINPYNVSGYFLRWRLFGEGVYFRGKIADSSFDLSRLKLVTYDLDNDYVIHRVEYNETEVKDDGGDWRYNFCEFDVGFSESPQLNQ